MKLFYDNPYNISSPTLVSKFLNKFVQNKYLVYNI